MPDFHGLFHRHGGTRWSCDCMKYSAYRKRWSLQSGTIRLSSHKCRSLITERGTCKLFMKECDHMTMWLSAYFISMDRVDRCNCLTCINDSMLMLCISVTPASIQTQNTMDSSSQQPPNMAAEDSTSQVPIP